MITKKVSWDNPDILWGLTDENTEEEILKFAFELIARVRFMPTATVSHGHPENRIIDFNLLSDGNLYFMTSRGKPFYRQLCEQPEIVLNTSVNDLYALKMRAFVKEIPDTETEIWEEFFERNPGTKKMYRKNFSIVAVFRLERGEGEMFHLYAEERIRRLRFAFGGMEKLPMTYRITEECIGCGTCQDNCVEQAIHQGDNGKYYIRYMDCDDCGICYTKCPLAGTAMVSRLESDL